MSNIDSVSLISAADERVKKVRTQGKDYSFNELLSMFEDGELVIDPEYQRLFRWPEANESRFIESLILELPSPAIFVIEVEEGRYELIDGLQRLSSYLHFRGKLSVPERMIKKGDLLCLTGCDIVKELNGFTFATLPESLRIKLKRNSVRVEVIRKESDKRLRYHMFKRLNTGGAILSEQEIRNCTIRLVDDIFVNFIIELSKNEDFTECISLAPREQIRSKLDQELVLRFFTFKNWADQYIKEVHPFMTRYMEAVSGAGDQVVNFDYSHERLIFERTFKLIKSILGDEAFSSVKKGKGSTYPFTVYQYESFVFGVQPQLDRLSDLVLDKADTLKELFWSIKKDSNFQEITTGGGQNTKVDFLARTGFVANKIREANL